MIKVGEIGKRCSSFPVSLYKENKQTAHSKYCASKRNCVPNPQIVWRSMPEAVYVVSKSCIVEVEGLWRVQTIEAHKRENHPPFVCRWYEDLRDIGEQTQQSP